MPPLKWFRDMDQLSGGDRQPQHLLFFSLSMGVREALRTFTVGSNSPAAINPRLFSFWTKWTLPSTIRTSPWLQAIRRHASDTFQFIVISLKGSLYEKSNTLVGMYRDQEFNSNRS